MLVQPEHVEIIICNYIGQLNNKSGFGNMKLSNICNQDIGRLLFRHSSVARSNLSDQLV